MSAVAELPVQPSLRRIRRFGVRPDRELGQNFLIDSNILEVIGRAAALAHDDVVLEVGGGVGVLSEFLAARVAHVHVVELDERLAAQPGSRTYGASSVMAQLACEVELLRVLPRAVFYPVPNVDSALVRMRRRAPEHEAQAGSGTGLRALVAGAFAHRRKTLAGSLALAGIPGGRSREQVRDALQRLGHRPDVRAERLAPPEFRALARALGL